MPVKDSAYKADVQLDDSLILLCQLVLPYLAILGLLVLCLISIQLPLHWALILEYCDKQENDGFAVQIRDAIFLHIIYTS